MELKQVILIRSDLKLPKGKMSSQAAHAAVEAVLRSDNDKVQRWRGEGMKKIILKIESEKELIKYFQKAKDSGLKACLISDAGRTIVEPGTKTAVGIGPDDEEKIDEVTGKLKII